MILICFFIDFSKNDPKMNPNVAGMPVSAVHAWKKNVWNSKSTYKIKVIFFKLFSNPFIWWGEPRVKGAQAILAGGPPGLARRGPMRGSRRRVLRTVFYATRAGPITPQQPIVLLSKQGRSLHQLYEPYLQPAVNRQPGFRGECS